MNMDAGLTPGCRFNPHFVYPNLKIEDSEDLIVRVHRYHTGTLIIATDTAIIPTPMPLLSTGRVRTMAGMGLARRLACTLAPATE